MELKHVACGARVVLDNGARFYLDYRSPGRTFICRMSPEGLPCEPVVVPIEPKGREEIEVLVQVYVADHPDCPSCGQMVEEPGFCDSRCKAEYALSEALTLP